MLAHLICAPYAHRDTAVALTLVASDLSANLSSTVAAVAAAITARYPPKRPSPTAAATFTFRASAVSAHRPSTAALEALSRSSSS
jgi:hypothetical protein